MKVIPDVSIKIDSWILKYFKFTKRDINGKKDQEDRLRVNIVANYQAQFTLGIKVHKKNSEMYRLVE